jgi:hypothetical protein
LRNPSAWFLWFAEHKTNLDSIDLSGFLTTIINWGYFKDVDNFSPLPFWIRRSIMDISALNEGNHFHSTAGLDLIKATRDAGITASPVELFEMINGWGK